LQDLSFRFAARQLSLDVSLAARRLSVDVPLAPQERGEGQGEGKQAHAATFRSVIAGVAMLRSIRFTALMSSAISAAL
jgi:hypothetical protein